MSKAEPSPSVPGALLRADAQQNRQKLLDAALEAFTRHDLNVSLEAVARSAGVGIGTLYRHFPSREALALAAYRHDVERLCGGVDELLASYPPDRALREWMSRFSTYIVNKRGMSAVIRTALVDPQPFYAELNVRGRMMEAVETLLRHGAEAGQLRTDMDAEVVMLALIGMWHATAGEHEQRQIPRLLDLLVDGLRATSS